MSGGVSGLDAYQDDDEVRGLLEKMADVHRNVEPN